MVLAALAGNTRNKRAYPRRFEPVMTMIEEGLVLGETVLAPMRADASGTAELAIGGCEERILALLAIAYGKAVGPAVLGNIGRAARKWGRGEPCLAQIHLAYSGLPQLTDAKAASARLLSAEQLLAGGCSPRELIKACGLDPTPLDLLRAGYNPDQPHVPAGNPDGGQWIDEDATGGGAGYGSLTPPHGTPSSAAGADRVDPNVEPVSYTPVHELPHDAVAVTRPDGKTVADPLSKTRKLMAPPRADLRKVYGAGGQSCRCRFRSNTRWGGLPSHKAELMIFSAMYRKKSSMTPMCTRLITPLAYIWPALDILSKRHSYSQNCMPCGIH